MIQAALNGRTPDLFHREFTRETLKRYQRPHRYVRPQGSLQKTATGENQNRETKTGVRPDAILAIFFEFFRGMMSWSKLVLSLMIARALATCDFTTREGTKNAERLRRLADETSVYPAFEPIDSTTISKSSGVTISYYYKSSAPFEDVKRFYIDTLSRNGWGAPTEKPGNRLPIRSQEDSTYKCRARLGYLVPLVLMKQATCFTKVAEALPDSL